MAWHPPTERERERYLQRRWRSPKLRVRDGERGGSREVTTSITESESGNRAREHLSGAWI